jgi:hypothetical protein
MRSNRSLCGGLSLSLASVLALSSLPGCNKLEELTGAKKDEAKPEEPKKEDEVEKDDAKVDDAKIADAVEAAPVEAIPVEPLATGLDLMLELVPEGADFVVVRDATVVAEYMEEAVRFTDGPLATLKTGPFASEGELQKLDASLTEGKGKIDAVKAALDASGIELKEGVVVAMTKGSRYFMFKAADPDAMVAVGKAMGEREADDLKCKAIEDVPGYNVCAEDDAKLAAYKRATDPAPARTLLADNLPGVDLDAANMVMHVESGGSDEGFAAVSTIPGQMYMAFALPKEGDMAQAREAIEPGPAKTLANVQPGAGFVWGRISPELLAKEMSKSSAGNPMAEPIIKALTGEFVLAGSVDPGGVILQAGTSDTATLEAGLVAAVDMSKEMVPKEIPEVPGSAVVLEKVPLTSGGVTAQAVHFGVTGVPEADVLKGYTGLHPDAWVFAANEVLTLAVGPDQAGVGKLLGATTGGPTSATLDTLPPQLAEGLARNEVGAIVHMPMDFLHGAQLHGLVRSALKDVPGVPPPEQLVALAGLLAPFSSSTMWLAESGDKLVIHVAVQAIGNRATDEGKAALDAAHTVADGGDPAVAFASLASAYGASPMAWAYKARAGTDGPGYMIGSGVGAVLAVAAVAVPLAMGASNKALAEDLGVKPEEPPPELVPTTAPKRPVTTTKPPKPKKDPKEDPKDTPPKEDPKEDPIVEPTRPLPPKPTPDPTGKRVPKRIGKGLGKGEK